MKSYDPRYMAQELLKAKDNPNAQELFEKLSNKPPRERTDYERRYKDSHKTLPVS